MVLYFYIIMFYVNLCFIHLGQFCQFYSHVQGQRYNNLEDDYEGPEGQEALPERVDGENRGRGVRPREEGGRHAEGADPEPSSDGANQAEGQQDEHTVEHLRVDLVTEKVKIQEKREHFKGSRKKSSFLDGRPPPPPPSSLIAVGNMER